MKKFIVMSVVALCVTNGLWGVKFYNASNSTISVSGAFRQYYTLAPVNKQVEVLSAWSLKGSVIRRSSIEFETGIQDYITIKFGSVENKQFKRNDTRPLEYDMRTIKNSFARINTVTFNADNRTLTVAGRFKSLKPQDLDKMEKHCYPKQESPRCTFDRRTPGEVKNIQPSNR